MSEINEIEAAARDHKRVRDAGEANIDPHGNWPLVALGVGVGSAALAAALMYANRPRKK